MKNTSKQHLPYRIRKTDELILCMKTYRHPIPDQKVVIHEESYA